MAGMLETIAIPRASVFSSSSARSVPIADLSVSGGRRSSAVNFSQFSGLKVQLNRSPVSLSSRSESVRRGGRIVCEAQESTTVTGMFSLFLSFIFFTILSHFVLFRNLI